MIFSVQFIVSLYIIGLHISSTYIPLAGAFYGKYPTKRIYVYDDPEWRKIASVSLSKRDPNELLESKLNHGCGPALDVKKGAYHTDQYQMFSMIYNRAIKDPRRTLDPSKATTFLIPYDLASDCAYYKSCTKSTGSCFDFRKCPVAPTVEALLATSPYFTRNFGKDHVLIVGMNYAMDHYIGKPKCKSLLAGICQNCTKFAIDDYSYMYGDDEGVKNRGDNWHSAPFPADFHWSHKVKPPFPWMNDNRPVVVSYVGSTKSYYNPARRIRGSIVHYCELHPELCVTQSYGINGSRSSLFVSADYNPLELSLQSVFCYQPIGDLMTRKGLFDSLLQGCIPVTFDPLTASVMYTWHWEEKFWNDISVEYPFHSTAFRYFDSVLALNDMLKNNTKEVKRKQGLIRAKVFQLQYSIDGRFDEYMHKYGDGNSLSFDWDNITISGVDQSTLVSKHWPRDDDGVALDDAYDIMLELCLGWHSGVLRHYRNATVPECWGKAILDPDSTTAMGRGQCKMPNPPKSTELPLKPPAEVAKMLR